MPAELEIKPNTDQVKKPEQPPKPEPGAVASSFIERLHGGLKKKPAKEELKPEPKKEEQKKEEQKSPEPKPDDKAKKPEQAPVKPQKKIEPVSPPPLDAEAIAEAAGRGVAAEMAKSKPQSPKEPDITDGFDSDEKETFAVLERMEKDYGTRYANQSKLYAESLKKAKRYQQQWEEQNPGKEFDAQSPEHNEFFETNDVQWDDAHFNRTLTRIEAEKLYEKDRNKESSKELKRLEELERKERLREAEPQIMQRKRATARSFFEALGPDYKDVISEDGRVNLAEVKRLRDTDPVREIAFQSAESVEGFTEELYRLSNGLAEFQSENPSHKFIGNFVEQQEILLRNLPSDKQLDDQGRRFATAEEYNSMPTAKRAYYWRLTSDDIAVMYAANEARLAQERISKEESRIEEYALKRGYTKKEAVQKPENNGNAEHKQPATPVVEKPNSPAGTVEPRMALPETPRGPDGQTRAASFTERWLGRR